MTFLDLLKMLFSFGASSSVTKVDGQVESSTKLGGSIKPAVEIRDGYYIWKKGGELPLSNCFTQKEFTCRCSNLECEEQRVAVDLIEKLTNLRNDCGFPLIITSGYRCEAHQKELGEGGLETAKNSQHVLGNAADVAGKDVEKIFKLSSKYFAARGKANSFIHLDLRTDKTRLWSYVKR